MYELPTDTTDQLINQIRHGLDLVAVDDPGLFRHSCWEVCEMIKVLNPSNDFTPYEMMALAVILARAHSRKLSAGPSLPGVTLEPRKFLRAV